MRERQTLIGSVTQSRRAVLGAIGAAGIAMVDAAAGGGSITRAVAQDATPVTVLPETQRAAIEKLGAEARPPTT